MSCISVTIPPDCNCALTFCRFAKEYSLAPGRGYGSGVIQVLKKLSSSQLSDVYQPARDQFNGRGSFGNGGAMRVAPFALAFPDLSDVKKVCLPCNPRGTTENAASRHKAIRVMEVGHLN